jgi:hypothetical protein
LRLDPGVGLQHFDHGVGLGQSQHCRLCLAASAIAEINVVLPAPATPWITRTRSLLDRARMPASNCSPLNGRSVE